MKKKYLFSLLLPLTFGALTGCGGTKDTTINIDIGTKSEVSSEISSYDDLISKLTSDYSEDFLLATYSKVYSTGCSCWSGFRLEVMDRFVKETNTPIYYFDVDKLEEKKEHGISKLYESSPEFYVIKASKVVRKYTYEQKNNNIMKSYTKFKNEMAEVIVRPDTYNLYYVDEAYLDKNLKSAKNAVLYTVRNACGDCKYATPNVVIPFSKMKAFDVELWVFDIQDYKKDDAKYEAVKTKFNLSETSNEIFGYGTGVVPTIQYYQYGLLKDASVFFNDTLVADGSNFKVSKTYYTEERVANLPFLKNTGLVQTKVLEGLSVPASDVTNGYWNKDAAAKYHSPILRAFINNYCL